jgi:hypothetical protein
LHFAQSGWDQNLTRRTSTAVRFWARWVRPHQLTRSSRTTSADWSIALGGRSPVPPTHLPEALGEIGLPISEQRLMCGRAKMECPLGVPFAVFGRKVLRRARRGSTGRQSSPTAATRQAPKFVSSKVRVPWLLCCRCPAAKQRLLVESTQRKQEPAAGTATVPASTDRRFRSLQVFLLHLVFRPAP